MHSLLVITRVPGIHVIPHLYENSYPRWERWIWVMRITFWIGSNRSRSFKIDRASLLLTTDRESVSLKSWNTRNAWRENSRFWSRREFSTRNENWFLFFHRKKRYPRIIFKRSEKRIIFLCKLWNYRKMYIELIK